MRHPVVFLAALLGLTACDAQVESRREAVPAAEAPPPPVQSRDPLVANGPAATVQPDADMNTQWAASVVRLDPLDQQGGATVKLFGTAGGDPAMNGLYTHIAFFKSSAEGWSVFRIDDVLDYEILSEAPGRVDRGEHAGRGDRPDRQPRAPRHRFLDARRRRGAACEHLGDSGPVTEPTRNRRTVAAYDDNAEQYAEVTRDRLPIGDEALARFADALGPGARVLEVASGPGWDADELEARGLHVRRTDLSEGFIAVQHKRGKVVEPLDLVNDDLGGPWDGLMALYVLQHIERDGMEAVIRRVGAALRHGGLFLTSFQEGEGEWRQTSSEGGTYTMIRWRPADMLDLMAGCGLEVDWSHSFEGDEARWTILIARRP